MFRDRYDTAWEETAELSSALARPVDGLEPLGAAAFLPLFRAEGFGTGSELDRAILTRAAEIKSARYAGRVFPIVRVYVTSICL